MSERKNIDRLFQEKFKDFEAEPSEIAWEKIEARLEEKKNRKVIPFWFKYAGVAAVFLIGLLLTTFNGENAGTVGGDGNSVVSAPGKSDAGRKSGNGKANQSDANTVSNNTEGAVTSAGEKDASDQSAVGSAPSGNPGNPAPGGSNASGIRQADQEIVAYPSNKKSDAPKRSRAGRAGAENGGVTSEMENGREQYASSGKNRKAGKPENTKSPVNAAQPEQLANNSGNADGNRNAPNTTKKTTTNANNITQDFLNQDKIAVNENNQSGQTEQHNNQGVTAKTTTSTQAIVANTDDIKKDSTALAMAEKPNALEELLLSEKETAVTQSEPKMNRWQVSPRVAPIYLSSSSNGSPIDSRFANNEKDYKTQLSYGLGVSYALNKRLSLRTGVNSLAFEYNTNNVVAKQSSVGRKQLEHVNPTVQGAFLRIENKIEGGPVELANNGMVVKEFSSSLSQKTGYFEIPVELSYKVIDKRFGIDVIGGFSTLLLNENEVSLISSENQMQVGKANNLNATSFSTNLGIGFRYEIWKSLQVNFEPTFKYQINTYTESGNFKPYFFGLYTGLNYRF